MCIVYTEIINSGWDWQVVRCGTYRGAQDGNEGGILTKEKKKGKEGDERRWFEIIYRLRGGGEGGKRMRQWHRVTTPQLISRRHGGTVVEVWMQQGRDREGMHNKH